MDSGTNFSQARHAQLHSKSGLAFTDVLSSDKIISCLSSEEAEYRDRIFTPDVTLWTFLSQVLGDDKSLQSAVTKLIAFKASQGETAPSAIPLRDSGQSGHPIQTQSGHSIRS